LVVQDLWVLKAQEVKKDLQEPEEFKVLSAREAGRDWQVHTVLKALRVKEVK
jgi:hypothetical protein